MRYCIFGAAVPTAPAVAATDDSSSVELGLKFTPTTSGFVTGVRFYKDAGNTGTHVGSLWGADGSLLARATFGLVRRAATEMLEHGHFAFTADAIPHQELNRVFARGTEPTGTDRN